MKAEHIISEILDHVVSSEMDELRNFREGHDPKEFAKAVEMLKTTEGKIIISGLGKSGHIGKKISATLSSIGSSSFFMHPTEALHGDLGMVSQGDTCILISHSGETDELVQIAPILRDLGATLIALTSDAESTLAELSDACICTMVKSEVVMEGIAPSSSATVTLVIGDVIAECLLRLNNIKPKDFAVRHPGGMLGRKLTLKVSSCMTQKLPKVAAGADLYKVLLTSSEGKLGLVLVEETGEVTGIITDGDIRRAIEGKPTMDLKARQIMTQDPMSVSEDMLAYNALKIMEEKRITSLLVKDDSGAITGVVHIHHILGD
jgi:arabinose-5-phosphate isomerase